MNKTKIFALLGCILLVAGCGATEKEEPIIMIDASEEAIVYNMEEISRGEVILTKKIDCQYVQTSQQDVSFPVGGNIVDKVYVRVGDHVEVGDVLVDLENGHEL